MSDQVSRSPQHSDPQKPGSEQKQGNQPNQQAQKHQDSGGQSKSPQSEHGKGDQEKKKQA